MDTSDHDAAMAVLKRFLNDGNAQTALLTGAAGTGKTHLVQSFLMETSLKPTIVRIGAPTNKAVQVLRQKLKDEYRSVIQTVHRLLHAEEEYDEMGELRMNFEMRRSEWIDVRLLIIDESSMLSSEVFSCLMSQKPVHLKILFIGDVCQLPPVDEKESPAFAYKHSYTFDLRTIKRTQSPDISFLYEVFRVWQHTDKDLRTALLRSSKRGVVCDDVRFQQAIRERISTPGTVILAYSNRRVAEYNKLARSVLFPNTTQEWCEGDRALFSEMCVAEGEKFYTNDEMEIDSLLIEHSDFPAPDFWKYSEGYPEPPYPKTIRLQHYTFYSTGGFEFIKVHEDSRSAYEEYKKSVRRHLLKYIQNTLLSSQTVTKLWRCYHDWRKYLDTPIIYAYSTTVHKKQGDQAKNVLIDAKDIETCCYADETLMKKCMYTAVTRAEESILINWSR